MIVNYLDRGILFVYDFKTNCPVTMKINLSKQAYSTDKPQKYISKLKPLLLNSNANTELLW